MLQPLLSAFFAADSRGTAARARFFGLQCLRGACFLISQPFVEAIFAAHFEAMSEAPIKALTRQE